MKATLGSRKATYKRTLPVSKGTAGDLLNAVKTGDWGKGVDWNKVEGAVARRKRSRELRPTV